MSCVSTKGAFRLIQSVPSPKAEPFKQWLAQVGYERVQEIENPELAQKRIQQYLARDGYSLLKVQLLNEFTITDAGRLVRL